METQQIPVTDNDEIEIDLKELFFVLLHRAWIILLAAVVCAGTAGVYTKMMITPQYQSKATLYVLGASTSLTSLADIQVGTSLTTDYTVLVQTHPVVDKVIDNLELDLSYGEFREKLEVTNPTDTHFIDITFIDADPVLAKQVVDEMSKVASKQMAAVMKTEEPTVVEEGQIAEFPVSPSTMKNCAIAGLLGLVAAAGIIILLYLMNDTLVTQDDVEKYLGLTTLGTIPLGEEEKRHQRKKKSKHTDKKSA